MIEELEKKPTSQQERLVLSLGIATFLAFLFAVTVLIAVQLRNSESQTDAVTTPQEESTPSSGNSD